jgi:hypothetical protein
MKDEVRILGTKVINGSVWRKCPRCKQLQPLGEFGLRRMAGRGKDGADLVTNQSYCRKCR